MPPPIRLVTGNRLRVITLADSKTVNNVFFDRSFSP
jgi:hypothetical protein